MNGQFSVIGEIYGRVYGTGVSGARPVGGCDISFPRLNETG